jgi:5-methylthioadenosine/S-adenosylhomocysteine deaminase
MILLKNVSYMDRCCNVHNQKCITIIGTKIVDISDLEPVGFKGTIIDCTNRIALPGYYNLHCHSPMGLLRGYGEGLPLHDWLRRYISPFESFLSAEDIYWGAMLGIAEMVQSGTVSFSDMYFCLDSICQAVEESGIKANISHGTTGFGENTSFREVNGWTGTQIVNDYVSGASHDRIIAEVGLHAEYTSKERLVREVAEYAHDNCMPIHLHLSETLKEHQECITRNNGMTPAKWFETCGVFANKTTAAHCVYIDEDDMQILAKHNVTVAHCPTSNLKLGSGIAPLGRMVEQGIRITIGTDGAASNNNLNMMEEIHIASILQKGVHCDSQRMSPDDIIPMATENGAIAQGRMDCGVIDIGYRADIVLYDLSKPHMHPVHNILSNIVYSGNSMDICCTIIDGKIIYQNGGFTTIDIEKVIYNVDKIKNITMNKLRIFKNGVTL